MNGSISYNNQSGVKIAIVGRPNVGKSTLFNRLVGKRRAITDPTPGVTRDAVREPAIIAGQSVELIDTGGYRVDAVDIDSLVREKLLSLLQDVDLVLLMLDVNEYTAEDESFVEKIRSYTDKLIVVVNKVDNQQREALLWDFYSLGFEHVVGVSAAHGTGIDDLEEKIEEVVDFEAAAQAAPPEPTIRIAVLGKPNTGKSTLSNYLIGTESSIVSDIPGTTRDVIEGKFRHRGTVFQVMDTAGIRRKKKVQESVEYYSVNRAFKTIEDSDVVLLLIDVEEGLTDQDKKIAQQAVKRGKGILIVLNKWDKVEKIKNQMQAIQDRVRYMFPILGFAPIVPLSAKTGDGIERLLSNVYSVWKQLNRRVETPVVNELIRDLVAHSQPPRSTQGHFKVYYATQVASSPVRFLIFVNRKKGFPKSYVQYMTNGIRRELGFANVPITVELRERSGHQS
ncbi:MAG: ribosome biogenesis GTPase Der [Spirochaetota bacterium]